MKTLSYIVAFVVLAASVHGQVAQSGDLTDHIDSLISNMPGASPQGDYLQPGASSRTVWRQIVQSILIADYPAADSIAATLGYQVVAFTDTSATPDKLYYILERTEVSTSRYWGTYVFNPDSYRPRLVIQCPHPLHDLKTGQQGLMAFRLAGARAYFVSGTHRCNGLTASSCDGTTTACTETAQAYRYSDQAHVVLGPFQLTTEEMLDAIPDMIVIQPHGFSAGTGDPDIILSNGTRFTPVDDYALQLRDNLLVQDPTLTFKIAHVDLDWDELIARNNCQGRLINNGSDPCGTDAIECTGRFIHLEQRYSGLRDTEVNRQKLANAIIATFPSVNQFASAQSGSWTDPATWQGGIVPGSTDEVYISAGHTVSIDDTLGIGGSLQFGGDDARLDLNAKSRLTLYGDITLFSESHNAFAGGWSADSAFIRLAGSATQTLSGWSTTGASSSFRDLIIDKDSGSIVQTSGVGMRLGVQNSLEIISGALVLQPDDDFEARWTTSGLLTDNQNLTVTIHQSGEFVLVDGDGTHFIRSGTASAPIGPMTVFGLAEFTDASSYDQSIHGITIKAGGQVTLGTGLGSTTYGPEFNPGTVTVDSGGVLLNETTSELWFDTSVVILNRGGIYKTTSSTTPFPPTFVNDGRVRYQRDPSTATTDQEVVDRDYFDLEFSFNGNGTRKLWTLTGDRLIADSLDINNSAEVIISADAAQVLTVDSVLRLTSGSLDISDPEVTLLLAGGVQISRATGTISSAPGFAGVVDVRYTSSTTSVSTGPELPTETTTLRDLTIYSPDQTVTLSADATVNHDLTLSVGVLDNDGASDDKMLSLAANATIRRATGALTAAPSFGSSVNVEYISTVGAVVTGPELPAAIGVLNDLTISGNMGVTLGGDVTVNGILHLADSILLTDVYTVTLAPTASLVEDSIWVVQGAVETTRPMSQSVTATFGGLGLAITAAGAAPGSTVARRVTGTAQSVGDGDGVLRYFVVTPTVNAALDATIVCHYADLELNGLAESELTFYRSADGAVWEALTGAVDTAANTVTVTGAGSLGWLTLGGPKSGCCIPPTVGDVNQSGVVDITDVSVLIDNQFLTLTPLVCEAEGDVDFSGVVDITDLSVLIDNQFLTLTPLGACP